MLFGLNRSWAVISTRYHYVMDVEHVHELRAGLWSTDYLFTDYRNVKQAVPSSTQCVNLDFHNPPNHIAGGRWFYNVGASGIQIAEYMGFDPIYLVGFDLIDGEGSCYPKSPLKSYARVRLTMNRVSEVVRKETQIVNCNPQSGIRCFPFGDLPCP